MADVPNPKRSYDSPRRREQAAATRRDILEAAQRLFERRGYATTKMADIATEAGVALKTLAVKERIAGVLEVIRQAALVDADSEALWERIQADFYENQGAIVSSLAAKGALAPGLDATRASDILWTLNHPDVWQLLVGRRGWTADQFEQWFADTTCAQLLAPERADASGS